MNLVFVIKDKVLCKVNISAANTIQCALSSIFIFFPLYSVESTVCKNSAELRSSETLTFTHQRVKLYMKIHSHYFYTKLIGANDELP